MFLKRPFFSFKVLLFVLVIFMLALQCTKKPVDYDVPQSVKDYMAFKPGSYWIYQDSASGALDSQYVISYSQTYKGQTDQSSNLKAWYQCIYVYMGNPIYDAGYCYKADETNINFNQPAHEDPNNLDVLYTFDTAANWSTYFHNPPPYIYFDYYYYFKESTLNNYTLNSIKYATILKAGHNHDWTLHDWNDTYYLVPNIGMVRLELNHQADVWNLIRYHVVQ